MLACKGACDTVASPWQTTFHHRTCGLTNVGLLSSFPPVPEYAGAVEPTIELIGDLLHVAPLALQLALNAKARSATAFITDAVAPPVSEWWNRCCVRLPAWLLLEVVIAMVREGGFPSLVVTCSHRDRHAVSY